MKEGNRIGKSLSEILKARFEKLAKIREMNINPYEYEFHVENSCKEISSNFEGFEGKHVSIAGRIMSIRRMGRASFSDIQDESGRIQLYFRENEIGEEGYKLLSLLDIGDIIGINGEVFKTKTGEVTVFVRKFKLLSKNLRPIPIVKKRGGEIFDPFTDKEQRYRQRYIDLIVNSDVKEVFRLRSKIIQLTREFLDSHGYLEVETPILQTIYGGAFAKPFKTYYNALNQNFYLRIADELYLKRLIIGGFDKVYEIAKNFRNEGIDRNHNPEFTLLEFYQSYVDYNYMMEFVEKYFKFIADRLGRNQFTFKDHVINLSRPFERKQMFDLLKDFTGRDLLNISASELKDISAEYDIEVPVGCHYGKCIELIFKNLVEPHLIQPTFVIDYPEEISPLAKQKRGEAKRLVERFELYIGGEEFANAFSELNDPIEQMKRFKFQEKFREAGDEEAHAMDEDFIMAMEYGMPPTGGVGIGMDRVVMLFTNQRSIKDVILFPHLRSDV